MDALCSFCVSLPLEPITLGCNHIMCKSCAQACTNNNEIVCFQCNQRSKLALSPIRSPSPKVGIPNKHILDESLKICSRSIAYIHNQQIYMQQFIEKEINQLIYQLEDRREQLKLQLTQYLKKKLEYYQECEIAISKKMNDTRNLSWVQPVLYEDNNFMDFSNLKILTEEIKRFGRRITQKKSVTPNRVVLKQNKENQHQNPIEIQTPQFSIDLPDLKQAKLVYKLGGNKKLQLYKRCFGQVIANGYKFGWYWNCENISQGYNSGECYIYTITNPFDTLPMKFIPRQENQRYSIQISNNRIGFGKDSRDLLIDLDNLKQCSSELGSSYSLIEQLSSQLLVGRRSGWNVEMIEIYQLQ